MKSRIHSEHWDDANGNPEGGTIFGNGFAIGWQHGPLGRGAEAAAILRARTSDREKRNVEGTHTD